MLVRKHICRWRTSRKSGSASDCRHSSSWCRSTFGLRLRQALSANLETMWTRNRNGLIKSRPRHNTIATQLKLGSSVIRCLISSSKLVFQTFITELFESTQSNRDPHNIAYFLAYSLYKLLLVSMILTSKQRSEKKMTLF